MAFFDFVPILQGKYLNYQQYIGYWSCFLFFTIGLLLQIFSLLMKKANNNLRILFITQFWVGAYLESYSTISLYGFQLISFISAIIFGFLVLILNQAVYNKLKKNKIQNNIQIQYQSNEQEMSLIQRNSNNENQYNTQNEVQINQQLFQNQDKFTKLKQKSYKIFKQNQYQWIIFLSFCIITAIILTNTCVCFFHSGIGINIYFGDLSISTSILRYLQMSPVCPKGEPCHIYATIPQNSSHSVFINIHTHKSVQNIDFNYQIFGDSLILKPDEIRSYDHEYVENLGDRRIHIVLLQNLKPRTQYQFQIIYDNITQATRHYRTPGSFPDHDLQIMNGGDQGNSNPAKKLYKLLETFSPPDALFIGGDIAYDNAMSSCYYTWDYVLQMYQDLTDNMGYLIPIIYGIGNHDIGLNPLSRTTQQKDEYGPIFYSYFPQHLSFNQSKPNQLIPDIQDRNSYFYHQFGELIFFSLDAGYVQNLTSQAVWMQQIIENQSCVNSCLKMAHYHQPIYYSTKDTNLDKTPFQQAVFTWIPIFDLFRFITVFENHAHTLKRTKTLKGNIQSVNGTLYLGDGSLGAKTHSVNTQYKQFFETLKLENHFWLTQVTKTQISHQAIGLNNRTLDEVTQQTNYYIGN